MLDFTDDVVMTGLWIITVIALTGAIIIGGRHDRRKEKKR